MDTGILKQKEPMNADNKDMYEMFMTVKDLKKALENVPDDCLVVYQRIEDIYFEENGWLAKAIELSWEENINSLYIPAFSAYQHHKDKDIFVINAHY